jgi:hypothetical protein
VGGIGHSNNLYETRLRNTLHGCRAPIAAENLFNWSTGRSEAATRKTGERAGEPGDRDAPWCRRAGYPRSRPRTDLSLCPALPCHARGSALGKSLADFHGNGEPATVGYARRFGAALPCCVARSKSRRAMPGLFDIRGLLAGIRTCSSKPPAPRSHWCCSRSSPMGVPGSSPRRPQRTGSC